MTFVQSVVFQYNVSLFDSLFGYSMVFKSGVLISSLLYYNKKRTFLEKIVCLNLIVA